ncbi:hypothetical protein H2200_002486 [Cladophialophora chaetospira]|uniref:Uncharacterized protein n=1 Tax=Cladophialophora chaetospira TaxID=386627 RepID=A0AA38XIY4_9EURO|nr:hypothetical protein H2200_002486 [Cladophialophora chaetospira]
MVAVIRSDRSLIDLPHEIRNTIYKFVYEEVTISCILEGDFDSWMSGSGPISRNYVSPGINLLLTCRQVHIEARAFLASASITVTGDNCGQANPKNFPPHVLERVRCLTVHDETYHWLTPSTKVFGLKFLDRQICPNLQVIWKAFPRTRARSRENFEFPYNEGMLPVVKRLLRMPCQTEEFHEKQSRINQRHILQSFKSCQGRSQVPRPGNTSSLLATQVQFTDSLIKERDLTMKGTFEFEMRGRGHTFVDRMQVSQVLFEERLTAVVVWDKNGVRIEELPDICSTRWWKEIYEQLQLQVQQGLSLLRRHFGTEMIYISLHDVAPNTKTQYPASLSWYSQHLHQASEARRAARKAEFMDQRGMMTSADPRSD